MNANQITKNAGLIALFYGRRGQMSHLQSKIGEVLLGNNTNNANMSDPHRKIYLFRADSPSHHDTTVIYLALSESYPNQPDDAQTTWSALRGLWQNKALKSKLDEATAKKDAEGQAVFWGYTLIYHAAIVQGQTLDEQTRKSLLKLARRPDLPDLQPSQEPQPLAHTHVEGSDLWLMSVPNQWHGSQAVTVYAALAPADKEDDLINHILFGPNAALQQLDLIAHKAYYQRRQFVSQPTTSDPVLRRLYKKRIGELRDTIRPFLGVNSQSATNSHSIATPKDFKTLKFRYDQLLMATSDLDEPRLSLAQQLTNYEWWQKQLNMAQLAEYHHKQIDITLKELELLIDKGQRMLDATQTTIEMEQAELEQKRAERENLIAALIAILGVALAISQIIDPTAAQALLKLLANLTGVSLAPHNRLMQLLVQLFITALVTGVAFWGYQWSRLKPPS